jgi:CRISPR-associated protein Csm4
MKAIILKTKPYSLFRLGSGSKDDVDLIIHSDTLFSAIINMHSHVFDNTNELIELFEGDQIKISSAFPLLSDTGLNKKIMFLPKPELDYSYSENIKAEKKIKFISFKVWEDIITEKNNAFSFSDKAKYTLLNENFVCQKDELDMKDIVEESDSFISKEITAKTKVHSSTQEDSFYHETNIQLLPIKLKNGSALYPHFYLFLESNCKEKYLEEVYTCLRLLADQGIGGERSSGKGHFEKVIIDNDVEFPEVSNPQKYFTISLTNPKNQEEFNKILRYDLIVRGGGAITLDDDNESYEFDTKPYRKKQVKMISEGALISDVIQGRLVDISPDINAYGHKFYRNGKCFLLPIG